MNKWTRYAVGASLPVALILLSFVYAYSRQGSLANSSNALPVLQSPPMLMTSQGAEASQTPAGTTCDPPCWMGIIPGTTTDQEAKQVVERLPGYARQDGLFSSDGSGEPIVEHSWQSSNSNSRSYIETQRGIVRRIYLYLDSDKSFAMRSVVKKYGAPGKFYLTFRGLGAGPYIIGLPYPEKGLFFTTGVTDGEPRIDLDRMITGAEYIAPTSLDQFIGDFFGGNDYNFYDWPSNVVP